MLLWHELLSNIKIKNPLQYDISSQDVSSLITYMYCREMRPCKCICCPHLIHLKPSSAKISTFLGSNSLVFGLLCLQKTTLPVFVQTAPNCSVSVTTYRNGVLLPKLFWLTVRWNCSRVESQYKNFWQNLVATFCPLFTWIKGTKCGDQGLSKIFVLWFYSS